MNNNNKGKKEMRIDALNATIVEYKNRERLRMKINLMLGDCLERMREIPDGSVDMVLTDPPYGTMNGFNGIDWDYTIDNDKMWHEINRVLRFNGRCILFSQEPYTSKMVTQGHNNVPFSYRAVWQKDNFANALLCNKAMVSYFEDICVFFKRHPKEDLELKHPIRKWLKEMQEKVGIFWNDKSLISVYTGKGLCKNEASAKVTLKHLLDWNYVQIRKITKKHYKVLNEFYKFDKTEEEIIKIFDEYQQNHLREQAELYGSTFNLWEGKKYKSNILKYKKDYNGYHPTQKPVLLLEDLIKTFSNEGDTVLDFTMGSGSTGVACVNTGRDFIGIEMDQGYFDIAKKRISESNE